jgi:hypothetical protein
MLKGTKDRCLIYSLMKFTKYFYSPFQGVIGREELEFENEENKIEGRENFDYLGVEHDLLSSRLLADMTS